jgi:hypothetical protein
VGVGVGVGGGVGVGDGDAVGDGDGVGVGQSELRRSEKARTEPVSIPALSLTFKVQTPFGSSPLNAVIGLSGLKVPVIGSGKH